QRYTRLFEQLSHGQTPHTLFITCSDSRIDPCLITASKPGELFIVRGVGNLVPPATLTSPSAVAAAIDYAIGILGITQIVVCAHSGCGAIKALMSPASIAPNLPNLQAWVQATESPFRGRVPRGLGPNVVARLNVLLQLDNLRTYPLVAERLGAGELA